MSTPAHPILVAILLLGTAARSQDPATLSIPAYCGYAYPDARAPQRNHTTGVVKECKGELHYYFECSTTGQVRVEIERTKRAKQASIEITCGPHPGNRAKAHATLAEGDARTFVGAFGLPAPGVHKLTIKSKNDEPLRDLKAIVLSGVVLRASTVERRNASSVHLSYQTKKQDKDDVEWFYCELTPKTDPLWTYYMATGWHRGYFGMQVNSEKERRIIFSVWDAGNEAVDRKKVKKEDLVQLLRKGDDVYAGGFGNEGTGGHSHLVHDWKLGDTVRFLVHAEPDGKHTTYTGWFSHVRDDGTSDPWQLVASFKAPRDGRYLHGLYSFSENFSGANGDRDRQCDFGNIWLRNKAGVWSSVRTARFSHDGHGKIRSDRRGGMRDGRFFLQHGNFAIPSSKRGTQWTLPGEPKGKPPLLPQ